MPQSKAEFKDAITSGDPDRVNAAIEAVKGPNTAERAQLFVSCIEEFTECYYVEDGYQRLSVVRFLRALYTPHIPTEYRGVFWDMLCDAIADDDGRVRKAAVKAMDKVITLAGYCEQSVEPLRADLADLADTQVPTYSEIHSALSTAEKYTGESL
jgi:HEAT repeat protein